MLRVISKHWSSSGPRLPNLPHVCAHFKVLVLYILVDIIQRELVSCAELGVIVASL